MNFYDWMVKKNLKKDTPEGDLARDMVRSGDFPHTDDMETISTYLSEKNACMECLEIFLECWQEYMASVIAHA